ncbi:metalloendopeptidase pepo [Gorgonomyces haynaldii]|nr:metalloendopeptidase pepo [Gorgonomyces haynaldii]
MDAVDASVKPSDDFYKYCNNHWLKQNEMPPEKSTWGTFNILNELSKTHLRELFSKVDPDSVVASFYESGMNTALIEEKGLQPLEDIFQKIDSIQSASDAWKTLAFVQSQFDPTIISSPFFLLFASPDDKNAQLTVAQVYQGGLGLGNRDYYDQDSKAEIRQKYVVYLEELFGLLGSKQPKEDAKRVFDFETKLALQSLTSVQRRDPQKTYNKFTLESLKEKTPGSEWDQYFGELGLKDFGPVIVESPDYISFVAKTIKEDLASTKLYMKAFLTAKTSPYLPQRFLDLHFGFFKTTMAGIPENEPLWKRVVSTVSDCIRDIVSEQYVKIHFPSTAKTAALDMVNAVIEAFKQRLLDAPWMTDETKAKAMDKLNNFRVKIGYPDKWMDLSSLDGKIKKTNAYLTNIRLANSLVYRLDALESINKPVDKSKWLMPPFMVNAYFHPTMNEIVFPAAILQPPFFFAPTADKPFGEPELNFGAIGAVISHEISHGYDDQGRQYDAKGELNDWWSEKDGQEFKNRAQMMVDQFDNHAFFGEKVNGKLTQGENIADLGGVVVALAAYKLWASKHPEYKPSGDFTPEQRFFLSWGQVWRIHIREAEAKKRIVEDPHSPGYWRVNGILNNVDEFYTAFSCKEGDAMYLAPDRRVKIW